MRNVTVCEEWMDLYLIVVGFWWNITILNKSHRRSRNLSYSQYHRNQTSWANPYFFWGLLPYTRFPSSKSDKTRWMWAFLKVILNSKVCPQCPAILSLVHHNNTRAIVYKDTARIVWIMTIVSCLVNLQIRCLRAVWIRAS